MILRAMYRFLLHLRPRQWRGEMLSVFEQAQSAAWASGPLAYAAFGAREVAGLLRVEHGAVLRWALGGLLAGFAAGYVATLTTPEMYTSRATIQALDLDIESVRQSMSAQILSRHTLVNIIQVHGLYHSERTRMPMEAVVDLMRGRIEIRLSFGQAIALAFSDSDPDKAQMVARDIMTGMIDATLRERKQNNAAAVKFLTGEANLAAAEWDRLSTAAKSGTPTERLMLDRALASRRYETLRNQVSEAEAMARRDAQSLGPRLELLDLPSRPERPQVSHLAILAASAFGGILIGALAGWLRRLLLTSAPAPAMIGA